MKRSGYILFSTMLMLGTLTLLVLSLMQSVLLNIKAMNQHSRYHKALYDLESAIHKTIGAFNERRLETCLMKEALPDTVITLLKEHKGCIMKSKGHTYRYMVENLGNFPCFEIKDMPHVGSHHWRLTMIEKGEDNLVIQVRFILPEASIRCENVSNMVAEGIVSWQRY